MRAYDQAIAELRSPLPAEPELRDLIRFATLAPNSHNTQPWRFRPGTDHVDVLPDFTRRTPVVDPDDHHLYVTLGCAAENLVIAGNARGRPADATLLPDHGEGTGVRVTLGHGPARDTALCAAIPERQSTKSEYDGTPLSPQELAELERAAELPGVRVAWITERERIEEALAWVLAGNDAQMDDAAFVRQLKHWIRYDPAAALASGDGTPGACSGTRTRPAGSGRSCSRSPSARARSAPSSRTSSAPPRAWQCSRRTRGTPRAGSVSAAPSSASPFRARRSGSATPT